jgi:beta-lactamase superfamily II metal-dependent hydrolase
VSPASTDPVTPVPANRLGPAGGFKKSVKPEDLVHFVLNVGDGDTQLLLLPAEERSKGVRTRKAIVVDVVPYKKLEKLIGTLQADGLLDSEGTPFELVVATHPHADHISGMGSFLKARKQQIRAFMEPGFVMPSAGYMRMMDALDGTRIDHMQPSGGTVRFIDGVKVTVLAPGISLKNRYDSYGVDPNNSSIVLKIDFPARRYYIPGKDGAYDKLPKGATLLLGGDAQTLSWSQVLIDNPQLEADGSAVAKALRKARGIEPLNADVFKVAHHGSKHGINLELVEEVSPAVSLVSSVGGGGKYNFPHRVALESLREGLEKTTQSGATHSPDYELGIHFTAGREDGKGRKPLGTIAVVVAPSGRSKVWRFGDEPGDGVDLAAGRPFKKP